MLYVQAASTAAGSGLFRKLGRVLREKAAGDLERVFKGASKTREKLGVSALLRDSHSHFAGHESSGPMRHCQPINR